eukprot:8083958-Heterocapsa_arctica.AAC.1
MAALLSSVVGAHVVGTWLRGVEEEAAEAPLFVSTSVTGALVMEEGVADEEGGDAVAFGEAAT